jgi:adenylate cyclase
VIQITRATYELIADEFDCEPRGTIEIKGKGEMEVWHLLAERVAASCIHPAPSLSAR